MSEDRNAPLSRFRKRIATRNPSHFDRPIATPTSPRLHVSPPPAERPRAASPNRPGLIERNGLQETAQTIDLGPGDICRQIEDGDGVFSQVKGVAQRLRWRRKRSVWWAAGRRTRRRGGGRGWRGTSRARRPGARCCRAAPDEARRLTSAPDDEGPRPCGFELFQRRHDVEAASVAQLGRQPVQIHLGARSRLGDDARRETVASHHRLQALFSCHERGSVRDARHGCQARRWLPAEAASRDRFNHD